MKTDLPLKISTPDTWAPMALENVLALLNDHAHLEQKAANNAMSMLSRWPSNPPPKAWVSSMMAIAKDEIDHLILIHRVLERRGASLSKYHINEYASALNKCIRKGEGQLEHIDRLMVSALIEARSCERFLCLGEATTDDELKTIYKGLWASEKGHFNIFLDMAKQVQNVSKIEPRWQWFLQKEADIIQAQPRGCRIHSWV